jgi:hypothetical protein
MFRNPTVCLSLARRNISVMIVRGSKSPIDDLKYKKTVTNLSLRISTSDPTFASTILALALNSTHSLCCAPTFVFLSSLSVKGLYLSFRTATFDTRYKCHSSRQDEIPRRPPPRTCQRSRRNPASPTPLLQHAVFLSTHRRLWHRHWHRTRLRLQPSNQQA